MFHVKPRRLTRQTLLEPTSPAALSVVKVRRTITRRGAPERRATYVSARTHIRCQEVSATRPGELRGGGHRTIPGRTIAASHRNLQRSPDGQRAHKPSSLDMHSFNDLHRRQLARVARAARERTLPERYTRAAGSLELRSIPGAIDHRPFTVSSRVSRAELAARVSAGRDTSSNLPMLRIDFERGTRVASATLRREPFLEVRMSDVRPCRCLRAHSAGSRSLGEWQGHAAFLIHCSAWKGTNRTVGDVLRPTQMRSPSCRE